MKKGCKTKRRGQYTRDFKIGVIREVESGKTLAQVSRENGINPSLIVSGGNNILMVLRTPSGETVRHIRRMRG